MERRDLGEVKGTGLERPAIEGDSPVFENLF